MIVAIDRVFPDWIRRLELERGGQLGNEELQKIVNRHNAAIRRRYDDKYTADAREAALSGP